MKCKGKDCESKFGDNSIMFNLADQASNNCKYFETLSLAMECVEPLQVGPAFMDL